ncbi:MAG TPA: metallophosphoesterase [Gemmatimonadota bacterium]|nr:metallophosphoesterase [Gemmatimonadota bacterium]
MTRKLASSILVLPFLLASPLAAQDVNVLYPSAEIEDRLRSAEFEIQDLRGSRMEGDRTQRAALGFQDGRMMLVKWAGAAPGGDAFNNHPRYEVAAYEFQKLFLDEPDYIVPPTVIRAFPVEWYRETVDPRVEPTFRGIEAVLVALQYWLFSVTDQGVYSKKRLEDDAAYARHFAHASLFGYLVGHRDANVGNFLISTGENGRVFGVDNGHAFGLERSNRGDDWRELRVDHVPARAIERLRAIDREVLDRALETLVQFQVVDDRLEPAAPTAPLDRNRGTRVRDGVVQLGLTADEIDRVDDRIRKLLERVDDGSIRTVADSLPASLCDADPVPPAEPAPEQRLDGEHGLWVSEEADGLGVGWITDREGPGVLAILEEDGTCREHASPPGRAHRVVAPVAGGVVHLRYGSAADPTDRHETTIDLGDTGRHGVAFSGVDSLWVVGDVHGAFGSLVALLRNAGLVGGDLGWTGGRAHLVVLGDVMDRGRDVTGVLWFLHRLEREAESAGGAVHVVLGNHELMVLTGDLRYAHPKELELAATHKVPYNALFDVRRSVLGRWLASKPGILEIDDVLLAHGGVGPGWAGWTAAAFDDSLAAELGSDDFHRVNVAVEPVPVDANRQETWDRLFRGGDTAFWLRDWVRRDDQAAELDAVLDGFDAGLHVVGHTPVPTITSRYDGRVIAVDVEDSATEMLLLERTAEGLRRWVVGLEGEPEPL